VIEAAQAAVFDASITEVGAAMRALDAEQPRTPGIVAEEHEILAHHAHGMRRTARRDVTAQSDRLPVRAQQRARRRPGLVCCRNA